MNLNFVLLILYVANSFYFLHKALENLRTTKILNYYFLLFIFIYCTIIIIIIFLSLLFMGMYLGKICFFHSVNCQHFYKIPNKNIFLIFANTIFICICLERLVKISKRRNVYRAL